MGASHFVETFGDTSGSAPSAGTGETQLAAMIVPAAAFPIGSLLDVRLRAQLSTLTAANVFTLRLRKGSVAGAIVVSTTAAAAGVVVAAFGTLTTTAAPELLVLTGQITTGAGTGALSLASLDLADVPPIALGVPARVLLVRPVPTVLGVDAACIYDTNAAFSLVAGNANLGQALARRYITPRGALWYDLEYGEDLRRYLNAEVSGAEVANLPAVAEAEAEKDPRIQSCKATAAYDRGAERINLTVRGWSAAGPFRFVFSVTRFSVELASDLLAL